jgi:hypothetical protein
VTEEAGTEGEVGPWGELAHDAEDRGGDVFGRDAHLAGDVVAAEFFQVAVALFAFEQVETDAGADGYLLHARNPADRGESRKLVVAIQFQVRAALREAALAVGADPAPFHLAAGGGVHVGGGAADVGDVAPEVGQAGDGAGLADDGVDGAPPGDAALVGRERAEGAGAKAAAVRGDGEADRFERGDTFPVARVGGAGEGQVVDAVEFGGSQRYGRWILDDEAVGVGLDHGLAGRVGVLTIPEPEGLDERAFVGADLLERRQQDVRSTGRRAADHAGAGNGVKDSIE